jgi:hypothetical protein
MRTGSVGEELDESRAASKRAGFRGPAVVLADRFDCRSRRAARGQERPGVKSAWKRPRSSRPLSGAGRRRSVGSRVTGGQARAPVAGSRSRAVVSPERAGGGPSGHSSMEGASGRSEPQPLNGAVGKAVSAAGGASKGAELVATGASEVDAHSPSAEDNTAERGAPLRGLADIGAHQGIRGARHPPDWRGRERNRLKRVERRQARHGPARRLGFAPGGRAPRKRRAHTGNRAIVQVHVK